MSDTKYVPDLIEQEKILPDFEVVRLRGEVAALKRQLDEANSVLEENGLTEAKPKEVTPHEKICHQQIAKLAELSNKGLPFAIEDIKSLEILVKTLLAIQGKSVPVDEKKPLKKKDAPKVADLLAIVKNSTKVNE